MSKAMKTYDFEILFLDSPEYFEVKSAKMMQEGALVRFILFDNGNPIGDLWYPIANIFRIKRSF